MADISDVSNALVTVMAQALYPGGTDQTSAIDVPVIAYAGWPTASRLDSDLAAFANGGTGKLHATVFPTPTEKPVPVYSTAWRELSITIPTLTLTVSGQAITVGGMVNTPQNVAVLVDGGAYTYAVQPADTLASIATALAALIPGASSNGAVITVAQGVIQAVRAGSGGTLIRETKRQVRTMQITAWADTPDRRDALASVLDIALSAAEWLTMPDGTLAKLTYQGSHQIDAQSKANVYRRDIFYTVEYATTQVADATTVVVAAQTLGQGISGSDAYPNSETTYQ